MYASPAICRASAGDSDSASGIEGSAAMGDGAIGFGAHGIGGGQGRGWGFNGFGHGFSLDRSVRIGSGEFFRRRRNGREFLSTSIVDFCSN